MNFTCHKKYFIFWAGQKLFAEYLLGLVNCCWSFYKFALKTFVLTFQSDTDLFSILPGNKSSWYENVSELQQSEGGKHIPLNILVYITSSEYFLYILTLQTLLDIFPKHLEKDLSFIISSTFLGAVLLSPLLYVFFFLFLILG